MSTSKDKEFHKVLNNFIRKTAIYVPTSLIQLMREFLKYGSILFHPTICGKNVKVDQTTKMTAITAENQTSNATVISMDPIPIITTNKYKFKAYFIQIHRVSHGSFGISLGVTTSSPKDIQHTVTSVSLLNYIPFHFPLFFYFYFFLFVCLYCMLHFAKMRNKKQKSLGSLRGVHSWYMMDAGGYHKYGEPFQSNVFKDPSDFRNGDIVGYIKHFCFCVKKKNKVQNKRKTHTHTKKTKIHKNHRIIVASDNTFTILLNGKVSGKKSECGVPFDEDLYALINVSGSAKHIEICDDFIVDDILRAYSE